jgi:hypothetical protein
MAAPADAAGGSSDAFEVIRVHQVWPLAFLVGFGHFVCHDTWAVVIIF